MANDLFPEAREKFLAGEIDWADDNFKVALLSSTLDESGLAAAEFFDDLTDVEATEDLTGTVILSGGVADADDVSVAGVPLSTEIVAVVIYKDTTVASTSPLVAYMDTNDDSTPISRISDGGAIAVVWSNGDDRIFRL